MKSITLQQIFNAAVDGMRKQKAFSVVGGSAYVHSCLYRGPNGTRCAIGFCIPDEMYSAEMEGKSADVIIPQFYQLNFDKDILLIIQSRLHDSLVFGNRDGSFDADKFEGAAREFAQNFDLKYTAPISS